MAESTLTLKYTDLLQAVGWFLGYGRDDTAFSAGQTAECDDIIQSGYRQFLIPEPLNDRDPGHVWSFLSPKTTLSLVAGTVDYDLPDNFDGLVGAMAVNEAGLYVPIQPTGEGRIRMWRSQRDITGRPKFVAIRPKAYTGATESQRFEALIWPEPDASYTLDYRYNVLQNALTSDNPYPLGGAAHAQTLRESCLACAEMEKDEEPDGPHQRAWRRRLAASIKHDQRTMAPTFFGYNADNSDGGAQESYRTTYVTVGGVRQN